MYNICTHIYLKIYFILCVSMCYKVNVHKFGQSQTKEKSLGFILNENIFKKSNILLLRRTTNFKRRDCQKCQILKNTNHFISAVILQRTLRSLESLQKKVFMIDFWPFVTFFPYHRNVFPSQS